LDPYVNAIHVSLLREKGQNPAYAQALVELGVGRPEVRSLCEKLLAEGPAHLQRTEKVLILSDAEVLPWLHRQAWLRPSGTLARFWQEQIRQYAL
jgi:membrane glycosyltransferase